MNGIECMSRAGKAAKAAGFRRISDLEAHVIHRGWRAGDDMLAFSRAQAIYHHVVQPLRWATHDRGEERARWVRCAAFGALMIWLRYPPA